LTKNLFPIVCIEEYISFSYHPMTNYSDEISIRTEKLSRIKTLGIIPYAAKFDKKDSIVSLIGRDQ